VIEPITQAERRIRPWILETPLESTAMGLSLKLEHLQHTGSFKARGAFNKLLTLPEARRAQGVIAASTGNHGAAVAYAAGKLGVSARIIVPEAADPGKLAKIRALGGQLATHGTDSGVAELFARAESERLGIAYVSPYNDPDVIAGQGTIGLELLRQLPSLDAVFIALGGGGLLAGVAAVLKAANPGVKVIACSPENSAVMIHSIRAGRSGGLSPPKRPLAGGRCRRDPLRRQRRPRAVRRYGPILRTISSPGFAVIFSLKALPLPAIGEISNVSSVMPVTQVRGIFSMVVSMPLAVPSRKRLAPVPGRT